MPGVTALFLAAFIGLASVSGAAAQVVKPRPSSSTDRLPRPAKVIATQEADGPIRVVWSAVEGAKGYTLTRSDPSASTPLALPNEADTQYVDREIKPGITYYYLVSAVNEAGISGMKLSAPPVKAADSTANKPPDTPAAITAVFDRGTAHISWSSMRAGDAGYLVERTQITDNRPPTWVQVRTGVNCCRTGELLHGYPAGVRIRYRISVVKPNVFTGRTGLSNEITIAPGPWTDTTGVREMPADTTSDRLPADTTTGQTPTDTTAGRPPTDTTAQAPADTTTPATTNVRPAAVAPPARLKVGGSVTLGKSSTFTGLRLRKARWLSLDESKATVDSRGKVLGRAAGFTYIVAIGLAADGSVASMVQRVDVARR